ncbi:MAG: hypothetical protein OEV42_20225 [Deltaproteobacteria bacterium]|nr:hypothetical protein [Deltaproteobacteria bacterium]
MKRKRASAKYVSEDQIEKVLNGLALRHIQYILILVKETEPESTQKVNKEIVDNIFFKA